MRFLENFARTLVVLACIALAGGVVYFGYHSYWRLYDSAVLVVLLVLGGLLSGVVACILHELGHILFGCANGFKFNSVHIGFVKLYRKDGRLRLTVRELPEGLAGAAEMIPKRSDGLYARYLRMVFGGLFFSFLFLAGAVTAAVLYFYVRMPFAVYALCCAALPYAFYYFFNNLIPRAAIGTDTDGGVLFGLLKKDAYCMSAVNILAIEGYLYQGYAPGEIEPDLYFGAPQLPEDDVNFLILLDYRLMYHIDRGEVDKALAVSDRLAGLLEYVPKIYLNQISADILFCECSMKEDKAKARAMYEQLKHFLRGEKSLQTCRILAAYELYVNGDRMAALHELSAAEQKADACPVVGVRRYERLLLSCIRDDIIPEHAL